MAIHAIVRTDLMHGTDNRADLVSIKYMGSNGETPTAIDNGNILKAGALMKGEREILVGTDVAADTPLDDIVLIATPEVMYDERKRNLEDYENEAGKVCRGYRLRPGDVFSVTKEAFSTEPGENKFVDLAAGTKLKPSGSAGNETIGDIIAVETAGRYTYYVVRIRSLPAKAGIGG